MKRCLCLAVALLAVGIAPRLSAGGEVDDAVARMTAGVLDPATKARKILESVQAVELKADLAVGVLEKALDLAGQGLAGDSTALQIGLDVLGELDKRAPAKAAQWSVKRLDLVRRGFQTTPDKFKLPAALKAMDVLGALGDQAVAKANWAAANEAYTEGLKIANTVAARRLTFEAKQHAAAAMADAERKVAAFKAKLAEAPDNPLYLKQVLEALVVDKDDPQAALKLLNTQTDETWRTYLPLAAKDPKLLPAPTCVDVYKWYRLALAPKAGEAAKERMLRRARTFLQGAVDRGELKELAAIEARTQLATLDTELKQFDPVAGMIARQGVADLTRLVDLETDATPDGWLLIKGVLSSSTRAGGVLAFPVDVKGDYRLILTYARTQAAGDIQFTFPVAGKIVILDVSEYTTSGYSYVGSRGSSGYSYPPRTSMTLSLENLDGPPYPTATNPMNPNYASRTWVPYTLEIGVKTVGDTIEIATILNGAKWASWRGLSKGLIGPAAPSGRGFTVQFTEPGLAVSAAKLRPTGGEVTLAGGKPGDEPRTPPTGEVGRTRPVRRPIEAGESIRPIKPAKPAASVGARPAAGAVAKPDLTPVQPEE